MCFRCCCFRCCCCCYFPCLPCPGCFAGCTRGRGVLVEQSAHKALPLVGPPLLRRLCPMRRSLRLRLPWCSGGGMRCRCWCCSISSGSNRCRCRCRYLLLGASTYIPIPRCGGRDAAHTVQLMHGAAHQGQLAPTDTTRERRHAIDIVRLTRGQERQITGGALR